ncbi:hypothetical protein GCM10023238_25050 [Streptomyces heliomycini]
MLRGSYHLYQGIGGFIGNMVMGVVFVYLYRRWGRVGPLVVAHTLPRHRRVRGIRAAGRQGGLAADGVRRRHGGVRPCRTPRAAPGSDQQSPSMDRHGPSAQQGALAAYLGADAAGAR